MRQAEPENKRAKDNYLNYVQAIIEDEYSLNVIKYDRLTGCKHGFGMLIINYCDSLGESGRTRELEVMWLR